MKKIICLILSSAKEAKPENWDLIRQLEAAKIPVPDYIKVSRQLPPPKK